MIIRMTLYDNDFFNEMIEFVDGFTSKYAFMSIPRLTGLITTINPKDLSDEDRKYVCKSIKDKWNNYIDDTDMPKITKKQLKEAFRVSIENSFKEMDENCEVFYYFSHAKKYLYQ